MRRLFFGRLLLVLHNSSASTGPEGTLNEPQLRTGVLRPAAPGLEPHYCHRRSDRAPTHGQKRSTDRGTCTVPLSYILRRFVDSSDNVSPPLNNPCGLLSLSARQRPRGALPREHQATRLTLFSQPYSCHGINWLAGAIGAAIGRIALLVHDVRLRLRRLS